MKMTLQRSLRGFITALMLMALVSVLGMPVWAKADSMSHTSHRGSDTDGSYHEGWTEITDEDELIQFFNDGGNGYLAEDMTITDEYWGNTTIEALAGKEYTLCLNGHSILSALNGPVIWVNENSTLIIYDEINNSGVIGHVNNASGNGVVVQGTLVLNGGSIKANGNIGVNIYGGKLIMNGGSISENSSEEGAGIYADRGEIILNGGSIDHNTAQYCGGGVYLSNSKLTFNSNSVGGVIDNNTAGNYGGGIYCKGSTVIMNGGYITNNHASYGAGIYSFTQATLTLNSGNIALNEATEEGGGVYSVGTMTTKDGMCIHQNKAGYYGGGVYNYGTLTLNGGDIKQNEASSGGGGIYGGFNKKIIMNSGNISENAAAEGAGIYSYDFTMKNGTVKNNTASDVGGGLKVKENFLIEGGRISGNTANLGKGILICAEGLITGGNISDDISIGQNDINFITYNPNKGSGNTITQYYHSYKSDPVSLAENRFTRSGFIFHSWNTKADGSGTEYTDEVGRSAGDLVLYAQWKPDKYTVKFYPNGGSGTMYSQNINYNVSTALSKNKFTYTGYVFKGWNTKADGTGTSYSDGQKVTLSGNSNEVLLFAQWKVDAKYKVEHYKQKLDGTYNASPDDKDTFNSKGADSVTPAVKTYTGFTSPAVKTATVNEDGSTVVKYLYTRNSYTLTWNLDGGSASGTFTTGKVKYEAPITAPVPVKKGYTFKGWSATVPTTMPAKNVTIKALWDVKYATVTFNVNGGKALAETSKKIQASTAYGDLPTTTRTGYVFDGWYTAKSGGTKVTAETVCEGDITLYAHWKAAADTAYKVEHYKEKLDGKYNASPDDTDKLSGTTGATVTPEVRTYKGFTAPATQSKEINADGSTVVQYYYTRNSYTLSWDFAGGSASGSYTSGSVKYETPITQPVPVKKGYIFNGWNTSVPAKMPAKNVKYTAVWREPTEDELATVKFDLNKGDTIKGDSTMKIMKGTEYGTLPKATRAGYKFVGWYTERLKGTKVFSSTICNESIVLYARWEANEKVSYKVEHYLQKTDGTYAKKANKTETKSCLKGQTVSPKVLTYDGFNSPSVKSVKISKEGVVVKYQYTRKAYTLKWDFNGGSASGSYTSGKVLYGAKITAPVPVRDGYKFAGWNKSVPSTMPNNSLTIKAKWKKLSQEEEVSQFVERFYDILLERPSDKAGLKTWTDNLISGKNNGADVAVGIVTSEEFKNKPMSDDQYVRKLYAAFFDRDPDKAGYDIWMRKLKSGASREEVLRGFINSEEFQNLCKKYGIKPGSY